MLHGRFTNVASRQPGSSSIIVRLENGRLASTGMSSRTEATRAASRSGLPMFGQKFPIRCYLAIVWQRLRGQTRHWMTVCFRPWIQPMTQHTRYCVSRRSVADEATATDLLHGKPEVAHVGALAEGRFSQQIALLFDRNHSSVRAFWCTRWDTSRATHAEIGADISRTRRNIARGSRRSLDPVDSVPTWATPSTISREIQRKRWPAVLIGESSG